jgi:glutaredoxin-like protein
VENREGQPIPDVSFHVLEDNKLANKASREVFKGKTVILFGLPGAFTPTCSNRQVPRFNQLAPEFHAVGVDDIVCLSVNDPWVMAAWAREQAADQITFIPDSDAEFTRQMGMLVDKRDVGLGRRSRRYAMLVRDGTIEKMFVEPDIPAGDPYGISDADTMLRYLNPDAKALAPTTLFAKRGCPFCARAKELLDREQMPYETIYLDEDVTMQSVLAVCGAATVPQVFTCGERIGGADELERYLQKRKGKKPDR